MDDGQWTMRWACGRMRKNEEGMRNGRTVARMETLSMGIVRFAIGMTASMLLACGLAMACPKGKHRVCHYDPDKGKSVCHCVPRVQEDCPNR